MSPRPLALAFLAGALVAASAGCRAHARGTNEASLRTPIGEFVFVYEDVDRVAKRQVEEAVQTASSRLQRWGGLEAPVTLHILPSHAALEEAVNRPGYRWLRAWARYDEVFLQSPRTWSLLQVPQREIDEWILHELTHSVMYQRAARSTEWRRKGIPMWFREGMASYTASQGYRWPSLEDLARFYERHPEKDAVAAPEALARTQNEIAYGAAHHAFSFLVRRYGEDGVRAILAAMKEGRTFDEAFADALALPADAFVRDFKRYVRWRGFRPGRWSPEHRATPVHPPGRP